MSDCILICGGGTGGHFFSGLALAEKYLARNPSARIVFVGTARGIEARHPLEDARMSVKLISSRGIKGKGVFLKLAALFSMAIGCAQSLYLLFKLRPKAVIGVGGYASAPTLFAAVLFSWLG